jgi:hypothetical protein
LLCPFCGGWAAGIFAIGSALCFFLIRQNNKISGLLLYFLHGSFAACFYPGFKFRPAEIEFFRAFGLAERYLPEVYQSVNCWLCKVQELGGFINI